MPIVFQHSKSSCRRRVAWKQSAGRKAAPARVRQSGQRGLHLYRCKAEPSEHSFSFDRKNYYAAHVDTVRQSGNQGPVILLKIEDGGKGLVLPVFVGEAESSALVKEMHQRPTTRPMTHDLFKTAMEVIGHKVVLVRIHNLVGNTYYARLHLRREDGSGPDLDIDARPSDAINMAVRFHAPVLVEKDLAHKMAMTASQELVAAADRLPETQSEISRSCREEILMYQDPTIMYNLQLQMAIEEERYEDASKLRDQIEKIMNQDLALKMVIGIESALADGRYDEAAALRDQLHKLRTVGLEKDMKPRSV
eukprot:TRINITY_DN10363_c1_g1_i10.p1 TRINITY_DN10363_c1_g1~~TRINITY_DN10363_c1_g1_i10.p1  ORF type:complete len:307 (-),score=30.69 TRINITY_DN10363_c1_g1_i10:551-1471(-)